MSSTVVELREVTTMTVTAIQIGLDPDVIDCASPDFAQFPGLSKEKLRAANDELSKKAAGAVWNTIAESTLKGDDLAKFMQHLDTDD